MELVDDETTAHLRTMAKDFATKIPEGEFSPADLQDYLLVHKKDPQQAVSEVQKWMEKAHEERKKKEDDLEVEREARREEKKRERDRFREESRLLCRDWERTERVRLVRRRMKVKLRRTLYRVRGCSLERDLGCLIMSSLVRQACER